MPHMQTTTIDPRAKVVTLINIYEVAPEKQAELAELLSAATDETFRHMPGFISVNIHRRMDGNRVANYSQWASKDEFRTHGQSRVPSALSEIRGAPAIYQVSSVHTG